MKEQIVARLTELEEESRKLESGEESYGDSDEVEIRILDARIEELKWVIGTFPV